MNSKEWDIMDKTYYQICAYLMKETDIFEGYEEEKRLKLLHDWINARENIVVALQDMFECYFKVNYLSATEREYIDLLRCFPKEKQIEIVELIKSIMHMIIKEKGQ